MPHVTEHRVTRFAESASIPATVEIPTTAGFMSEFRNLIVPRNTRAQLIRMHGSIAQRSGPTSVNTLGKIVLVRSGSVAPRIETWRPLWSQTFTVVIVGTPSNSFAHAQGVQIEVNLTERIGNDLLSKGTQSNVQYGWALVGLATVALPVLMELALEWKMTWIGNSGSEVDYTLQMMGDDQ